MSTTDIFHHDDQHPGTYSARPVKSRTERGNPQIKSYTQKQKDNTEELTSLKPQINNRTPNRPMSKIQDSQRSSTKAPRCSSICRSALLKAIPDDSEQEAILRRNRNTALQDLLRSVSRIAWTLKNSRARLPRWTSMPVL